MESVSYHPCFQELTSLILTGQGITFKYPNVKGGKGEEMHEVIHMQSSDM